MLCQVWFKHSGGKWTPGGRTYSGDFYTCLEACRNHWYANNGVECQLRRVADDVVLVSKKDGNKSNP